jgi:L-ribulose-5-phosphate 3-epimerase
MFKMSNKIGVMQGRLLPKFKGRYQAHPVGYWQEEFFLAADLDLDMIEFILDFNDVEHNPLLTDLGQKEIGEISQSSRVMVKTICADYFMEAPLHSSDTKVSKKSTKMMEKLIDIAYKIEITDIVLPCVDQSSLKTVDDRERLINVLNPILLEAEKKAVNISLETDLSPDDFVKLLYRFNSINLKVNYDIGNSAALGFNPVEELDAYGSRISDIHIKDRNFNGGPVILGDGDAKFDKFFEKLVEIGYKGPFIMQAFRDNEGISIFKKQLEWIKRYIN